MTLKEKLCEPFGGLRKETADKLEKIADDYAIEFLEWFDKNAYSRGENSFLLWDNDKEPLTSKELLEIFKKEKGL
jgi:hypothetical protein